MSTELAVLTSLLLVLLAGVSAFFSGMETALFSITGFQIRRWRERDRIASADLAQNARHFRIYRFCVRPISENSRIG